MIEDPPADRIRYCLQAIEEDEALTDPMKREAVLTELSEVVTRLEAKDWHEVEHALVLCGKRGPSRRMASCDRPEHHKGECSWEVERIRRLASDYEAEARSVPRLRAQLASTSAQLARSRHELDVATLKWRARRRLAAEAKRRKADERG